MEKSVRTLTWMYDRFNARDIDGVLSALADDVVWANGMDGGHVHGRDAVRAYWTRQWAVVTARVEPISFDHAADGSVIVRVEQIIRDLDGRQLQDQTHGLRDKQLGHVFRFSQGKVVRFDIQAVPQAPVAALHTTEKQRP